MFIGGDDKGKTHLLYAIGDYVVEHFNYRVLYITATQYIEDVKSMTKEELKTKYENVNLLIVDEIENLIDNSEIQLQLLELFNKLYRDNKQVVFGSSKSFSGLSYISEDLRNKMVWGITIDINRNNIVDTV